MIVVKKILTVTLILTVPFFVFVAASLHAEELVIGEVASLSGRLSKPGMSIHQGVEIAVLEANKRGGIGGRQIRLAVKDDGGNPQKAVEAAEYLCLKEKAVAITGGYVDSLVGPVAEVAEKYDTPYVAAASLQTQLTDLGLTNFFRISNIMGYVRPMARVIEDMGARNVAIIHSTTPGATELASLLSVELEGKGVTLAAVEKFKPGTSDFTAILLKVFKGEPDVLVSLGFFQDNLLLVRQMKENNLSPGAFFGAFGLEYQTLIEDLKGDAEYLVGTTAWEPGVNPPGTEKTAEEYITLFKETYGCDPEPLTMHGYASARVLIDALRRLSDDGKPLGSAEIRAEIRKTDLLVPMERIRFDEKGEPLLYQRFVFQIRQGQRRLVFPPEVKQIDITYPAPAWNERR